MGDEDGGHSRCAASARPTRIETRENARPDVPAISCVADPLGGVASDANHAQRHLPALRRTGGHHCQSLQRLRWRVADSARSVHRLRGERDTSYGTVPCLRYTAAAGRSYVLRSRVFVAGRLPGQAIEVSSRLASRPGTRRVALARRRHRDRPRLVRSGAHHADAPAQARVQPGTRNRTRHEQPHRSAHHTGSTPATRHRRSTVIAARHDCETRERRGCLPRTCPCRWSYRDRRRRCHDWSDRERSCSMSERRRRQRSRRLGGCTDTINSIVTMSYTIMHLDWQPRVRSLR